MTVAAPRGNSGRAETGEWVVRRDGPVRIIAHRGASREAPENTLLAFRRAEAARADGVELDVMRCGTGEVVVFHDDDLDRLAGRRERIRDLPLGALREVDLGRGQTIPTLEQVLDELGQHMLVNVELKTDRLLDDGLACEIAALCARRKLGSRVLVSSFNPLALARFRRLSPDTRTGLLFERNQRPALRKAWSARLLHPYALHPEAALVDAIAMAEWRRRGYAVHTWTVDDPREGLALAALGVDGIITNEPQKLRAALQNPTTD